ncbi:MAG: A/G-specific adenine glycosylase [Rhodobacteraceae bacterium]|nr:A/G-specific adenine glycosylase [Paracoccaceae bacterium]MCP5342773.1 A/G-specific adenine glycosylase [Paracoccaceae bacterium]
MTILRYEEIGAALLGWYDRQARSLPWRVAPADRLAGQNPDPYRVWLSEIMLQQTTVASVRDYFLRFTARWPDVRSLAAADDAEVMGEWAGLGYYARARNLLKCARMIVSDHAGRFPEAREALLALPGIGPYTAAAIVAIAHDTPATVVDGNVERVVARLFCIETPQPAAKPQLTALAARLTPQRRAGDHAQAMMDLGATICTPRDPGCDDCPLARACLARARGLAAHLPNRVAKPAKPIRHGIAYVTMRSDGAFLLEKRPAKGLLGGMLGWPGTDWSEQRPEPTPPIRANWQRCETEVRHAFTHFKLRLTVYCALVPTGAHPRCGQFVTRRRFRPSDLPTLMRKAYVAARPVFEND